jgi:hypothetical protein
MHRPVFRAALLATLAIALSLPAASQADVRVLLNDEQGGTELASFKTASCRRGKGKRPASLKFTAKAKSSNGYTSTVDLFTTGRSHDLQYGGPNQFTVRGPAGEWTNLNRPPNAPPGGGAIQFNAKRTRMGLGFSRPSIPTSLSQSEWPAV